MGSTTLGLYEIEFRSPIESDRLNNTFNDIGNDIGEAYRRVEHTDGIIDGVRSDLSYQYQQQVINMLAVSGMLDATSSGEGILYWSAYNSSNIINTNSRHDPVTGDVTLPWRLGWTKLPLYTNQYGENECSDSLTISINGAYMSKPHDAFDMVDNNPETAWVSEGVSPITGIINMPTTFSDYINSVLVSPFPAGGCTVTGLYYKNSAGSYISVPNFEPSPYPRRYYFTKAKIEGNTEIKFILVGTSLYDSENNLTTVAGIRDIDVSLVEFTSSSTFKVRLSNQGDTISAITYVNSSYIFDGSGSPVEISICTDSAGSNEIYNSGTYGHPYTGSINTGGVAELWAHYTLTKINGNTPSVRDITVRYI